MHDARDVDDQMRRDAVLVGPALQQEAREGEQQQVADGEAQRCPAGQQALHEVGLQ